MAVKFGVAVAMVFVPPIPTFKVRFSILIRSVAVARAVVISVPVTRVGGAMIIKSSLPVCRTV